MEEKIVTVDEVWEYYKKAIDAGNFTHFKTKKGMMRYIIRMVNNEPCGAHIYFPHIGKLMIKKEWIKNGRK